MKKAQAWSFAIAASCIGIAYAQANTIVFNNAPGDGSQQDFVLGMDFVVNRPVTVVELGAFDSNGDGFGGTIEVGIFDLNGTLVGSSLSFSGETGRLVGGSRFLPVTPFVLSPGTYSIVAAGFIGASSDGSGNTGLGDVTSFNDAGGALTLVLQGGRYNDGLTFQLPTENSGGYAQADPVFQAGTFVVVPDGGMPWLLLGISTTALGWMRRKLS